MAIFNSYFDMVWYRLILFGSEKQKTYQTWSNTLAAHQRAADSTKTLVRSGQNIRAAAAEDANMMPKDGHHCVCVPLWISCLWQLDETFWIRVGFVEARQLKTRGTRGNLRMDFSWQRLRQCFDGIPCNSSVNHGTSGLHREQRKLKREADLVTELNEAGLPPGLWLAV